MVMVTCTCGQKVTVHSCVFGAQGCFPAANWVQCGSDCEVGAAKGCIPTGGPKAMIPAILATSATRAQSGCRSSSDLAGLNEWVKAHPDFRRSAKAEPLIRASQ